MYWEIRKNKYDLLFIKNKATFMLIYCFSSSFSPKRTVLNADCSVGSFVSPDHNKNGRHFGYRLTFQTKTNILYHYEGILLVKLLWQNYQPVLGGNQD